MTHAAKLATALWVLLAIVVFNVTFDWQTRTSSHAFIASQLRHVEHGRPPLTINDGFRPMVWQAALDSSVWLVLIAAGGSGATLLASRKKR